MLYLNGSDVISGKEGRAYITIEGKNEELFYVKSIEATIEKNKAEIKALGRNGTQYKATGWKGTGSMTIYYMTSFFRKMMVDYVNESKDLYFDLVIVNEDPASATGKQSVTLHRVNLDSVIIGKLDVDSDGLEEEVSFTFEGVKLNNEFNSLQ